jgi:RNA polymerase sigma factor (sigma-70 family)
MTERSDADLLAATVDGDAEAFAAFYRRHVRAVLRYCAARSDGADIAADLTSEVFATALSVCARYRRDRGEPGAWLHGIADKVVLRSRRRGRVEARGRRRLAMDPLALDDEDVAAVDRLLSVDGPSVRALLEQLPEEHRSALEARIVDERDYDEIARSLQCSEAVVRQRVSRGLRRLRAQMEGDHAC